MRFLMFLSVLVFLNAAGSVYGVDIIEKRYMGIKNGHFHYNGKRVRFWGINLCSSIKREGDSLELAFMRMKNAGFNAVRLNLFDKTILGAGDKENGWKVGGKSMDLLDQAVALARKNNMFVWISFDRPLQRRGYTPADYDRVKGGGSRR